MKTEDEHWKRWEEQSRRGKIAGGFILIVIGLLLFAREAGMFIPYWVFSWPMLLITIGFYVGIKHAFRHPSWMVLVLLGSLFLLDDVLPEVSLKPYLWPLVLISLGLLVIFKPRRRCHETAWKKWQDWQERKAEYNNSPEDYIDSVSIFGAVKKNVISKDFQGGDVVSIFGGAEINLMQADVKDKAVLDITQVFGGTKLIVPPNWEIKSELVAIMGGIEDKRPIQKDVLEIHRKQLVLKGTSIFGGIDIKSY